MINILPGHHTFPRRSCEPPNFSFPFFFIQRRPYNMCHSPFRRECPPDPFVSVRHPERRNSSSASTLSKTRRFFGGESPFKSADKSRPAAAAAQSRPPAFGRAVWPRSARTFPPRASARPFSPRRNKSNLLGCTSCCGAMPVRSMTRALLRPWEL